MPSLWAGLDVTGDGESFAIAIPAYFQSRHVPDLQRDVGRSSRPGHAEPGRARVVPGRGASYSKANDALLNVPALMRAEPTPHLLASL